jgi:hypothetical protein
MPTLIPRAMKTPRCSRKLRRNFRANAPCGVADATSIYFCPVGRPRPPPQEVRRNRWHENSKAVFPPTNPAHVPARRPRCRVMQRALQVARAQSTDDSSCQALSARAFAAHPRRVTPMQDRGSVVSRKARPLRSSTGSPQALSSSSTHTARKAVAQRRADGVTCQIVWPS